MDSNKVLTPAGHMENNYAAPYDFSLIDVIAEAWHRVSGLKAAYWGALSIVMIISIVLNLIIARLPQNLGVQVSLNGLVMLVQYPLEIGLLVIGIRRAVDWPVRAKQVFFPYRFFIQVLGVFLVQLFFVGIAISIFVLLTPGLSMGMMVGGAMSSVSIMVGLVFGLVILYLVFAFAFATPLVILHRLSVWQAIKTSMKGFNQHPFKIFFGNLLMMVFVIVGMIPLGIGCIWTLPLGVSFMGILYRTLFGVPTNSMEI